MTPTPPEHDRPLPATRPPLRDRIRQAPVTYGLIAVFVLVWIAGLLDENEVIFRTFAKSTPAILSGEVWRLFTASFLHGGLLHLAVNSMSMASVGPLIERLYGRVQYLVAFLVGGAAGMVASMISSPRALSVGASAGLFAFLGLLLAFALRHWKELHPEGRKSLVNQVLFVVVLNLAIGFSANAGGGGARIDNAAHVGGLIGGFVLGFVLRPVPRRSGP